MKAACILVLAVALAAGGAAASPIAKRDIGMGTAITSQDLQLGTLSLALRSLLDASKVSEEGDRKPDINTVLFGVSTK
jgi:hypothetical protein